MRKRSPRMRVRVAHEPNRFSAECLIQVYEQLGPTESRIASTQGENAEPVEKVSKPGVATGGET
jgi:hypothetical protein